MRARFSEICIWVVLALLAFGVAETFTSIESTVYSFIGIIGGALTTIGLMSAINGKQSDAWGYYVCSALAAFAVSFLIVSLKPDVDCAEEKHLLMRVSSILWFSCLLGVRISLNPS